MNSILHLLESIARVTLTICLLLLVGNQVYGQIKHNKVYYDLSGPIWKAYSTTYRYVPTNSEATRKVQRKGSVLYFRGDGNLLQAHYSKQDGGGSSTIVSYSSTGDIDTLFTRGEWSITGFEIPKQLDDTIIDTHLFQVTKWEHFDNRSVLSNKFELEYRGDSLIRNERWHSEDSLSGWTQEHFKNGLTHAFIYVILETNYKSKKLYDHESPNDRIKETVFNT